MEILAVISETSENGNLSGNEQTNEVNEELKELPDGEYVSQLDKQIIFKSNSSIYSAL